MLRKLSTGVMSALNGIGTQWDITYLVTAYKKKGEKSSFYIPFAMFQDHIVGQCLMEGMQKDLSMCKKRLGYNTATLKITK